jgi:hypothetical protein
MDVSLRSKLEFPKREEGARNPRRKKPELFKILPIRARITSATDRDRHASLPGLNGGSIVDLEGLSLWQWSRPRKALLAMISWTLLLPSLNPL